MATTPNPIGFAHEIRFIETKLSRQFGIKSDAGTMSLLAEKVWVVASQEETTELRHVHKAISAIRATLDEIEHRLIQTARA